MFDLSGKKALITGATGGIGMAIVKMFHKQGAVVALADMDQTKVEALAKELGERVVVLTSIDLTKEGAADTLINEADDKMSGIDILVNNAGITRDVLAIRMTDEDWDKVININLNVPFRLSRAAIKVMMKSRYGRIINMASIVGYTGSPGQCNYVTSKGGIVAMSKAMAREVASRNITVNAIAPGYINTPMTAVLPDEVTKAFVANIPMQKKGEPEDVAVAALFLASSEASYITGQTIHVNGGMLMC